MEKFRFTEVCPYCKKKIEGNGKLDVINRYKLHVQNCPAGIRYRYKVLKESQERKLRQREERKEKEVIFNPKKKKD